MLYNYKHFRIDATSGLTPASAKVLRLTDINFYHEKKDDINMEETLVWKLHVQGTRNVYVPFKSYSEELMKRRMLWP